jgi:hypothetical protein
MINEGLTLITQDGGYDRAAIMRRASAIYRKIGAKSLGDWHYAMRRAWSVARGERQIADLRRGAFTAATALEAMELGRD